MTDGKQGTDPDHQAAWRAHELAQLRYFQALPLRTKMEAVEGMAEVLRRFAEMRKRGQFR